MAFRPKCYLYRKGGLICRSNDDTIWSTGLVCIRKNSAKILNLQKYRIVQLIILIFCCFAIKRQQEHHRFISKQLLLLSRKTRERVREPKMRFWILLVALFALSAAGKIGILLFYPIYSSLYWLNFDYSS